MSETNQVADAPPAFEAFVNITIGKTVSDILTSNIDQNPLDVALALMNQSSLLIASVAAAAGRTTAESQELFGEMAAAVGMDMSTKMELVEKAVKAAAAMFDGVEAAR